MRGAPRLYRFRHTQERAALSEIPTQADLTEGGHLALLGILTILATFEDGQKIQDGQGYFS